MQNNINIKIVLDTHVFLWLMNGEGTISQKSLDLILKVVSEGNIGLSAISLWEISMLHARGRILLNQSCLSWIEKSLKAPGIVLCPISPAIAYESSVLPGTLHGDPADRMIIATARILGVPLMTKDEKILDYGKNGYMNCLKA